jgi:isopentenyl-diphosphate Delta-isomerase
MMDGTQIADLIPAWDDDGTLRPIDKMEVHRRGLRHKAISVFVMAGSDVLLQRRALGKYHTPGLWANTCCTHPHWGEDDLTCAHRRLREELGIDGLRLVPLVDVEYRADVGGGLTEHEMVRLFVAHADHGLPISPNPDEVAETAWVDLNDLPAQVKRQPEAYTPWLRIYLDQHLDVLARPVRRRALDQVPRQAMSG